MKKALAFGCKSLLLHNYLQNGDFIYTPKRDNPKQKHKWQVIEHLQ